MTTAMPSNPIPPTSHILRTRTLAQEIITRHPSSTSDPNPILGATELSLLRRFVSSPASKDDILREHDMVDQEGDRPGTRAQSKYGSLIGYCIARHGTEEPALEEREIEMLRGWFEEGEGRK